MREISLLRQLINHE
jgi:serine/threonine protein kinase